MDRVIRPIQFTFEITNKCNCNSKDFAILTDMLTKIWRGYSVKEYEQYKTIGAFWDGLSKKYGMENLNGLGYN